MNLWTVMGFVAVVVLLLEAAVILRRGLRLHRGYFVLIAGNLLLLGWVVQGERFVRPSGAPTVELVGGLLACLLLVFVPRALNARIRRAFADDRFQDAARLSAVKEILVPGVASALEHEFYSQVSAARSGRAAEVVQGLRKQLVEAEPPLDEGIKERIITVLLFAERWREAAIQFETHLGRDPAQVPELSVRMVRAYGALGELEKAAQLVHRLEERLHPQDPAAQAVLLQARLFLLAYAGAQAEVERLLSHPALSRLPPRQRERLLSTARERARSVEPASLTAAHGDPLAVEPLLPIDRHLALFLDGVAQRATFDLRAAAPPPSRLPPPATLALIALNLCAYALFALLLGDVESGDHLVRGGASFHPAVRAGEWWRLWTAMFLHGGVLHLAFNLYGLLVLGRVFEPVAGTARFLCIYAIAGLAGNLASVYNPNHEAVFSLGASGAVLGVMAALMVTLVVRANAWPEGWRREVLWNLGVLLAIQIAIGYWMRAVDNFAHLGGLVGGAAAGLVLAPGGLLGRGRPARLAVALLLSLLCASAALSIMELVKEQPAETMARLPRRQLHLGKITLTTLAGSEEKHGDNDGLGGDEVIEVPALGLQIAASVVSATPADVLAARMAKDVEWRGLPGSGAKPESRLETAQAPEVQGWSGRAQSLRDAEGATTLLFYYARAVTPAETALVRIISHGEDHEGDLLAGEIARTLGSIEVEGEADGAKAK